MDNPIRIIIDKIYEGTPFQTLSLQHRIRKLFREYFERKFNKKNKNNNRSLSTVDSNTCVDRSEEIMLNVLVVFTTILLTIFTGVMIVVISSKFI